MRLHRTSWIMIWCVIFVATAANDVECQISIGYFSDVQKLGPNVNSVGAEDTLQTISADGLTIIFTSFREGGFGRADLYQATRVSIEEPFGPAVNLGPEVNTSAMDNFPSISSDGLTLYFASTRTGGAGNFDLYQATRATINDEFGNVMNLGPSVNTASIERGPNISADGLTMYFGSNRAGGEGGDDIYVATRGSINDPFANVVNLGTGVNSSFGEFGPSVSSNGLFIFFSDFWRPPFRSGGQGDSDIWVAVRDSVDADFGDAVNLNGFSFGSDVNREFRENAPRIAHDWPSSGSRLYFSSQPDGDLDIWQATWVSADCDGDGVLDINDVSCAGASGDVDLANTVLEELGLTAGDADGNGAVEFADFFVLSNNFGSPGAYIDGDFDFNGNVEFADFLILSNNFSRSGTVLEASVPEPNSTVLFLVAIIGVVRRRAAV